MSEVVFLDSNVLLNLLDVPGKNSDRHRVAEEFRRLAKDGALMVIPIVVVVEVGNHIAQLAGHERRDRGLRLQEFLRQSLEGTAPFTTSGASWDAGFLRDLLEGGGAGSDFLALCTAGIGAGDAAILLEVRRFRERVDLPSGRIVRLWSSDRALMAYA